MSLTEKILIGILMLPALILFGFLVLGIIGLALGRDAARYGCTPRPRKDNQ